MKRFSRVLLMLAALAVAVTTVALQPSATTAQTKLVMVFVPSGEAEAILFSGQQIGRMLTVSLGVPVETVVSTSYAAAIEAMCAGRADIGALNAFSYVLAHQKCGVEVSLVSERFGLPYYLSQISARADASPPINTIADLRGKRFAFVDPASTSGYLFPAAMLKKLGYDPDRFFSQTIFAGNHNNVILAIYRGQVDGGATFQDARDNVRNQFPDVNQKVKVVAVSNPIPNDTWSLSTRLSPEMRAKIKDRLLRISKTPDGQQSLRTLYSITGLTDVVELTSTQVVNLGLRFDQQTSERIVRKGDKLLIPLGDWFFQPIRDVATYLGIDLTRLAR